MVEHLGEGGALPGEGGGAGQTRLGEVEVSEQDQGPFTPSKTCRHKGVSGILGLDRRVQVDVGIR